MTKTLPWQGNAGHHGCEHVRTVPPLHSSPGWITQQKRQAFLYGCPNTDHQAKAQAYQALGIPSAVQSYLGLDAKIGMCRISDVRSQPTDRDPGYPATEQQGHGPDTAAIIACLLMHRKLIESCGMIYLIVDNRVVGSQTSLGRTSARTR